MPLRALPSHTGPCLTRPSRVVPPPGSTKPTPATPCPTATAPTSPRHAWPEPGLATTWASRAAPLLIAPNPTYAPPDLGKPFHAWQHHAGGAGHPRRVTMIPQ